jgi:hypothetical protein
MDPLWTSMDPLWTRLPMDLLWTLYGPPMDSAASHDNSAMVRAAVISDQLKVLTVLLAPRAANCTADEVVNFKIGSKLNYSFLEVVRFRHTLDSSRT